MLLAGNHRAGPVRTEAAPTPIDDLAGRGQHDTAQRSSQRDRQDGSDAGVQPLGKPTAQTGRGTAQSPEPLYVIITLKLQPVCESKHSGTGPFALVELRCHGIEDGSKDDAVRAGMFRQQTKKPVVVPDAVPNPDQFHESRGRGAGGQPGPAGRRDRGIARDAAGQSRPSRHVPVRGFATGVRGLPSVGSQAPGYAAPIPYDWRSSECSVHGY
ncbi:hypothetical protein Sviol_49080 [Streptomyces violascens]|uniref:Uncharacterized protein n=1 Tax=Streptomyces violascens TaxID=67381 RepID=A0ABQ3QTC0_9ACTN|nr:hypothetical protein Sviol_49080 [Streptomyces violascens]